MISNGIPDPIGMRSVLGEIQCHQCHSMRVIRLHPSRHIQFNYTLHQQTLEQVQSAKYLGLTITDNLDWGQYVLNLHARQLRLFFFGAIWHWHLDILRKLHTKHWFVLNWSMQLLFGISIMILRLLRWRRRRGLQPGGPCRRLRNTSSVSDVLDELEWPSLESRRERSSLTFFFKVHSGTVSLDKDKYLTPVPNLRRSRASHESQYARPFAYSDALKNSLFPRTIPAWNSLPSSVVSSKTIEEFKASI